ncbi:hypothetical protein [Nissabacter sp. SGAir0207]|uniref:hypothetical protein n=1 Tax=Nissabacter sp. SGAir0207 TaxID=2126321 RepID=UPI0010F786F3|nr:hypothetical protein [Nissabacter sp. SGAir0207]
MLIELILEEKGRKPSMQLTFYWAVPLVIMFVGQIFSFLFPSTAELTSPRFLFLYGSSLLAGSTLIGFSLKRYFPLPIWTAVALMLIVLIGSPVLKLLFEN